jgi:hypothetical protein
MNSIRLSQNKFISEFCLNNYPLNKARKIAEKCDNLFSQLKKHENELVLYAHYVSYNDSGFGGIQVRRFIDIKGEYEEKAGIISESFIRYDTRRGLENCIQIVAKPAVQSKQFKDGWKRTKGMIRINAEDFLEAISGEDNYIRMACRDHLYIGDKSVEKYFMEHEEKKLKNLQKILIKKS